MRPSGRVRADRRSERRARAVPETTSLFALLWRTRVIRHAHAASHVPSDTAGEHATSTPVLVRPARPPVKVAFANIHLIFGARLEQHEHEQKSKTPK